MRLSLVFFLFLGLFGLKNSFAQDTFSIVAVDSITGEVGSAGASCVDLTNLPGFEDDFLGELFPGVGAINTQAAYIPANQQNARDRMNAGDTPTQIINWLINNDVGGQPESRQYGVVRLVNNSPQSAAHTGTTCIDYKNHILGPNYAIQGNILLGQEILDSMETRFLNEEGDLACKLMAALQGAKVVGADTRCANNGTSSLFAFVKVAQPGDTFGNPSFVESVQTPDGSGIEPIDSLQTKFDLAHSCSQASLETPSEDAIFSVHPNPSSNYIYVELSIDDSVPVRVISSSGEVVFSKEFTGTIKVDMRQLAAGIYSVQIDYNRKTYSKQIVKH